MTRFASPQAAALAQQIDPQMAAGGGPTSSSTMPLLAAGLGMQQTTLGESGGIYPRLGSLSSSIDSAEQELQGINTSIDSLQSQIGQPSGGQPGPLDQNTTVPLPSKPMLSQFGPRPAVDAPGGMQSNPGNLFQMMMRGSGTFPNLFMNSRVGLADGGMEMDRQEYGLGSIVKGIKKGRKEKRYHL